jgi:hypothetical protein
MKSNEHEDIQEGKRLHPLERADSPNTFSPSGKLNLHKTGVFIDRWADTVEGKSELAETIKANLLKQLREKNMPDIRIQPTNVNVGMFSKTRPYIIATTNPGVTTAIYVAAHGKDLYLSWRTHVRGVLNTRLLMMLAAAAGMPTLCLSPCLLIGNVASSFFSFSEVDAGGIFAPALGIFIGFFMFEVIMIALAGYFIRGDFFAYFFIEPTIFDAEDITATNLVIHKAMEKSIESAGLDPAILRPKPDIRSGRVSETR